MTRVSVRRRGAGLSIGGLQLDPATIVLVLIIAGLALRVLIAAFLLPYSGLRNDIGSFSAWGQRLAAIGPGEFYAEGYFSDYPPGYLYVLWLLGEIAAAFEPATGVSIMPGLVKIPGVLADGGVAWMLFLIGRRFGAELVRGRWSGERVGVVAAAIYLFNPGILFDSAVWGQVDSVGTLAILATLYVLARGWTEVAAVGAVVALLVKFQYAFLVPIVAIVGLKRHLFGRSSDPAHDGQPDLLRVLTSLAAGFASLVALIWPFGLAVWSPADPTHSLIDRFTAAANQYAGLTINAMNIWRNPWSGLGDVVNRWGCDAPSEGCTDGAGIAFAIGGFSVTWQLIGAILFALAALAALWHVARRDDVRGIFVSTLTLAIAFFALPTRVHERYLVPAVALAAPFVLRNWRWALLFCVVSLSVFANVYWVYTMDWSYVGDPPLNPGVDGLPMARDAVLDAVLFTDLGVYLLSWMIPVALAILIWRAILAPRAEPVHFSFATRTDADDDTLLPAGASPPMPPAPGQAAPSVLPGPLQRVRDWLRPDPRDPYLREPRRRLDRLDLLLLIGLVVFAFVFRLWRLDTPRSMHFDEVYHARSATEWLADWQEGWTRDVYEWTHPMLAKYLIAAGIVVADPNAVERETAVAEAPTAMAVAPQRSNFLRPGSVVFTGAGGTTITARDAVSGEELTAWEAPGPVAALAYDEDNERLLVGTADSGQVAIFDLALFLPKSGPRAPPPGAAPIDTGLARVAEIVLPEGGALILFRGTDGIVAVERTTGAELARSELAAAGIGYLPSVTEDDAPSGPFVVASQPGSAELLVLNGDTLEPILETVDDEEVERVEELTAVAVGPIVVRGRGTDAQAWVPVGALPPDEEHDGVEGGISVFDNEADLIDTAPLPGAPRLLAWQHVANIMYIAGMDASTDQPAVWTIQPIGNGDRQSAGFAAFDTTPLPGEPTALAMDISDHDQDDDHGLLLVATRADDGGGRLVAIDAGSNAFAWRLSGIAFGSLLVGIIYLLAATMFSRRRIAVLAAAFVAVDAMSYVMSRISMNDIFVATFIATAYLLFWQIWSGRWARSAWWVLPLVGVLIGLAAATKWVGIYALAGLWVLVLARSQLGRFLLVAGIGFITVVAGFGAPWPFLVVCVGALALALLLVWIHPIRLTTRDLLGLAASGVVLSVVGLAFALAYDQVPDVSEARSAVELVFTVLARGAQAAWPAWIMLGIAAGLVLLRAAVSLLRPDSDRRWFDPAGLGGFAWPWIGASLAVIPLLVYFLAYLPYLQLGHSVAGPDAGPGYGWSLDSLHRQMFGYHFGLQAGHVASSPWWSWPLDLKPVWFYGHDFDARRVGVIYNGGNPILFWAGVPAIAWCGILAWKRRSLALVLLVAAFAFQFLPWTRIERATFQYHYLTALMFAMVAVAYVTDEALRSWSWRPIAIAFLVLAAVAGVLVFPMGAALAMPDWYINAARALLPWNYNFQFPDPPQGDRGDLISADSLKLAFGTLAAVAAGAFALFGRELWGRRAAHRDEEQQDAEQHQAYRPEAVDVDVDVLAHQEPDPDPDQHQADDQPPIA